MLLNFRLGILCSEVWDRRGRLFCTGRQHDWGAAEDRRLQRAVFWRVGNSTLELDVSVPPNSKATTLIATQLVGDASAIITESGQTIWSGGKYVPWVEGVSRAAVQGAAVAIEQGRRLTLRLRLEWLCC